MRVTFTGHRPKANADPEKEKLQLLRSLQKHLHNLNDHTFIVGGAPGFDTLALEVLLAANVDKSKIILAVPFVGFEKYAGKSHEAENRLAYNLNNSCGVKVESVGGDSGSFGQKCFRRNQYLVDNSDIIFTNFDGSAGGTKNTIQLAKAKNLKIVNVREDDHG